MKVEVLGVKIDQINSPGVLSFINEKLVSGAPAQIATINPEFVLAAQKNQAFRQALNDCALATADGIGLIWAAEFLTGKKLTRVTGADLCRDLLTGQASTAKIFLLGGDAQTAEMVKNKFPEFVVGYDHGGFLLSNYKLENNQVIIDKIKSSGANLLLVAFGQVKQEMWLAKNLPAMPEVKVAIGIGGTFDFLSGKIKRAPKFMRASGLEWLYRLIQEPKRWKRIYNAVVKFPILVIKEKMK